MPAAPRARGSHAQRHTLSPLLPSSPFPPHSRSAARIGGRLTIPRHAPALSRGTASFFGSLGERLASSPSPSSPSYPSAYGAQPYGASHPYGAHGAGQHASSSARAFSHPAGSQSSSSSHSQRGAARRTNTLRVQMPGIAEADGGIGGGGGGGVGAGVGGRGAGMGYGQGSGQGNVNIPDAYGAIAPDGALPVAVGPTRTHYRLTRREVLRGVANRFVHSTAYLYFYGAMALASTMTVVISLWQPCPGTLFYAMELGINACLIAEVGIRGVAFGRQFWKSTYNIVDLFLVLLCAITLAVLFFSHDCSPYRSDPSSPSRSGRGEELLDSLLLIVRNGAQLIRLLSVVRRSGSNVVSRVPAIDLNAARGYSLEIDLEDEEATRDRMRNGYREEERRLFEAEEEDEEL